MQINWNRIYEKQSGLLIGVAYRYLKDRRQAEDLVQDAFIKAIQKAGDFTGKGAFEAWLRRIVVNECLMYLRKTKIETVSVDDNIIHDTSQINIVDDDWEFFEDKDKRKIIERCNFSREDLLEIATFLPEHHRLVFNMYVIDNFSHKEIATQLNISENTSKSHLNRARKKLQDLLYEKALDMQKKKKRRSLFAAVWLSALFGKVSIVDAMHRKAFSNFTLPPTAPPLGLEQAILSAPATSVASAVSVGTSIAVTAVVTSAMVVTAIIHQNQEKNQPSDNIHNEETIETSPEIIETIEPTQEIIDKNFPTSSKYPQSPQQIQTEPAQEAISPEQTSPVIIHKTIFDTIYEE